MTPGEEKSWRLNGADARARAYMDGRTVGQGPTGSS